MNFFSKKEIRIQFLKYGLIGLITLLTDYSLILLGVEIFKLNVIVAASISYAGALLVHFNLNKYWNFKSFSRSYIKQIRTYFIASIIFYVVNISIIELALSINVNYLLGKMTATVCVAMFSFMFNRNITFQGGIRATIVGLYEKFFHKN
ncbi:MAG: GtrA family protein [Candidatus Buchananbacteria bacterium]